VLPAGEQDKVEPPHPAHLLIPDRPAPAGSTAGALYYKL